MDSPLSGRDRETVHHCAAGECTSTSSVNELPNDEWLTETRVRLSQLGKNFGR